MTKNNLALKQLITLAGSQKQLAKLLGVDAHSIHDWLKVGQISKKGALLVEASITLGKFFKAQHLRPDVAPDKWIPLFNTPTYCESRRKQRAYERTPQYKQETPVAVLDGLKK